VGGINHDQQCVLCGLYRHSGGDLGRRSVICGRSARRLLLGFVLAEHNQLN
jgi:hypothetical protein